MNYKLIIPYSFESIFVKNEFLFKIRTFETKKKIKLGLKSMFKIQLESRTGSGADDKRKVVSGSGSEKIIMNPQHRRK
jgi:hypothetical protein